MPPEPMGAPASEEGGPWNSKCLTTSQSGLFGRFANAVMGNTWGRVRRVPEAKPRHRAPVILAHDDGGRNVGASVGPQGASGSLAIGEAHGDPSGSDASEIAIRISISPGTDPVGAVTSEA